MWDDYIYKQASRQGADAVVGGSVYTNKIE
jgi:hypothetical protein